MADIKQGIVIKATDQFSKVLGSLSRKIDTASRSTQAAQTRFNNFTNATQGVSTALKRMALVGGAAVTGLAFLATREGMKFEDAIQNLTALTGIAGKDLSQMGDFALSTSKKFGMAASDILNTSTKIASAQSILMQDPEGLRNVVYNAALLGKLSGESASDAGTVLIDTMNLFGKTAKQASQISDTLASSAKVGKMPITPLKNALTKAAGPLASAGLELNEALALLQVGSRSGLQPTMVGRQIKNITRYITEQAEKEGIKLSKDFNLIDAITNISKKGLSETDITKLVRGENIIVFKQIMKDLGELRRQIDLTTDQKVKGKSLEMLIEKTKTLSHAISVFGAVIDEKLIKLYQNVLRPVLIKIIVPFSKFVDWLFSGSLGANALAISIGGLMGIFLTLFGIVSGLFALGTIIMWGSMVKSTLIATASVLEATFIGTAIKGFAIKIPASILVSIAHLKLFSANVWASLIKTRSLAGGFRLVGNAVKWMGVKLAVAGRTAMASFSKIPAFIIASIAWIKGATIATWAWATASWGAVKPMLLIGAKFAIIGALVFAAGYAIGSVIAKLTGLKPVNPFSMEGIQAMEDILKAFTDFFEGNKNNPILNAFMEDVTGAHKLTDTEKQTARIAQRTKAVRAWRAGGMSEDLIKENSIRIFNNINVKGNEVTTKSTSDSSKVTETTKSTSQVGSGMMTVGGYDMFAQQN